MKTYICEICGDAYLGSEAPAHCPFCGARRNFIKIGSDAKPMFDREGEVGEVSMKNLKETYDLEIKANAIYTCMAGKAQNYEIRAMFKRLAKVELEHASAATKLMKSEKPETTTEECSDDDIENFKRTIELEEHASSLYDKFAKEAEEEKVKIFFTALAQVEKSHIELIKMYL